MVKILDFPAKKNVLIHFDTKKYVVCVSLLFILFD